MKDEMKGIQREMTIQYCNFCGKHKATESITDSETLKEVKICLECDKSMNWK